MTTKLHYPPKISCPDTTNILLRDRLFKKLDDMRRQSKLIWIAAPAGSGKTTLLSSYIMQQQLLHCWYQVDEGDTDLATFFHYLGLAGKKAAPRRKKNMTKLTSEYLQNITAFTRNFFEEISSRLKGNGIIILDNFQLIPENNPIHSLLPDIVNALAEGISLIIISRELPAKSLMPLLVKNQLTTLDPNQVRFNADEWNKVSQLLKPEYYDGDALSSLHHKLNGWIAGLVLSINAPDVFDKINPQMSKTNILEDYIADEFLSTLDSQTNELLMSVCYLPRITLAAVKTLMKFERPQNILAELARKNLFVLQQGEKGYTLHPLVQEYLKRKVANTTSKQAHHNLLLASAKAMLLQNEYEAAADLLLELQEWAPLVEIILEHAKELYDAGRIISLQRYIGALPNSYSENEPWIDYWNGNLIAYRDIKSALEFYDNAYTKFLAKNNAKGAYLTWHAALSAISNTLQGGTQLATWLNRHNELSHKWPQPPQELKRYAIANILAKCYFITDTSVQKRTFWRDELALIINETDTDTDALCLRLLPNYLIIAAISGIREQDVSIFKKLEKWLPKNTGEPAIHIDAIIACATFVISFNENEKLLALEFQALKIAESNGVSVFNGLLYMGIIYAAVKLKKFTLVKEYLKLFEKNIPQESAAYKSSYLISLLHAGAYMDDIKDINKITKQHLSSPDEVLLPAFGIHVKLAYLYYLYARAQTDEALTLHDELLEQVTKQALPAQISRFYMIYAKIFFNNQLIDKSEQYLKKSIETLSNEDIISYYFWPPELMSWACQRALALDIESAYVERFIKRHAATLPVPNSQLVKWPWIFRLYTFGRFKLINDKKIDDKSQPTQKPFQLLMVLAIAENHTLPVNRIKDMLYGEHKQNKTAQLLDNHLHRLRKGLQHENAVLREGDNLKLNPQYFWVDSNVFEALLKQEVTQENAAELATQIQTIYRGEYMVENDSIDCIAYRERYRNLFMSFLFKCFNFMESNTEQAIEICLQALVREPFSEPLYRKLITLYLRMGNREMAETSLLQCRNILQQHHNKDVSEKTLALLDNN